MFNKISFETPKTNSKNSPKRTTQKVNFSTIYMFQKIFPIFQFGDLIWVRRTDRRLAVWLELADLFGQLRDSATSAGSPFAFGDSPFRSRLAVFTFFFFISAHHFGSPFDFGGSPFLIVFAFSQLASKGEVLLKTAQGGDFGGSSFWLGALPLHFSDLGSILAIFPPCCGFFALILHLLHFKDSCSIIYL